MSRFGFFKMKNWEVSMEGFALTAVIFISTLCLAVSVAALFCLRDVLGLLGEISEEFDYLWELEGFSAEISKPIKDSDGAGAEDEAEEKRRTEQKRWDEGIANLLSFNAGKGK